MSFQTFCPCSDDLEAGSCLCRQNGVGVRFNCLSKQQCSHFCKPVTFFLNKRHPIVIALVGDKRNLFVLNSCGSTLLTVTKVTNISDVLFVGLSFKPAGWNYFATQNRFCFQNFSVGYSFLNFLVVLTFQVFV